MDQIEFLELSDLMQIRKVGGRFLLAGFFFVDSKFILRAIDPEWPDSSRDGKAGRRGASVFVAHSIQIRHGTSRILFLVLRRVRRIDH